MGQSKASQPGIPRGYTQATTMTPQQQSALQQLLQIALPQLQQGGHVLGQFASGQGGQPIANEAQRRYQQFTQPSLVSSLGRESRSSSALNQALAAGASDLNSSIAAQLAQMQLGAAGSLAQLGGGLTQAGISEPGFAYLPQSQGWSRWGPALGAAGGGLAGGLAGAAAGGVGAIPGALAGGAAGAKIGESIFG